MVRKVELRKGMNQGKGREISITSLKGVNFARKRQEVSTTPRK